MIPAIITAMRTSENPGLIRKFLKIFSSKRKGAAAGKRWAKEFSRIDKLVENKNFNDLESALDDTYRWLTIESSIEDIQPEWLNQAGLIYQNYAGGFCRAEECFRLALLLAEKNGDIRGKALAKTNLGVLFLDQNRSGEAIEIFTSLKPLIENHFGHETRETATVCQNLAAAYRMDGKEDLAKKERIESTGILRKLA